MILVTQVTWPIVEVEVLGDVQVIDPHVDLNLTVLIATDVFSVCNPSGAVAADTNFGVMRERSAGHEPEQGRASRHQRHSDYDPQPIRQALSHEHRCSFVSFVRRIAAPGGPNN